MQTSLATRSSAVERPRKAPRHQLVLSEAAKLPAIIMFLGMIYAILRYHVLGDVSLDHFSLYVLNKGISLAGLVLLVMSRFHQDALVRRYRGLVGFLLTGLHLVISMPILQPAYFGKLFLTNGTMNWNGELSILAGIIGFALLSWLFAATLSCDVRANDRRVSNRTARPMPRFVTKAALFLTAIHVGVMGYSGWWNPGGWPGYLPPITLLSCVIALAGIFWPKRKAVTQTKTYNDRVIPLR